MLVLLEWLLSRLQRLPVLSLGTFINTNPDSGLQRLRRSRTFDTEADSAYAGTARLGQTKFQHANLELAHLHHMWSDLLPGYRMIAAAGLAETAG